MSREITKNSDYSEHLDVAIIKSPEKALMSAIITLAINDADCDSKFIRTHKARLWLLDHEACIMYCDFIGINHAAMIEIISKRWTVDSKKELRKLQMSGEAARDTKDF